MYRLLADAVAIVHLLFVVFVVAGGTLALRWPRAAWAHVPAALWGTLVEIMGWECPLTPLENRFRMLGGAAASHGDFVAKVVLPVLYPERLTPPTQMVLGALVVAVNLAVYACVIRRHRAARKGAAQPARDPEA